ncbi:MAG: hypothetical protein IKU16_05895 [Muribaculaceae bacterium]|nr:hypothetical protein [Muribaculaceae bacterium]
MKQYTILKQIAKLRDSMAQLVAAIKSAADAFVDFGRAVPRIRTWRRKAQRLPQRRTIGKEHRGYAKSRLRIHQRRG